MSTIRPIRSIIVLACLLMSVPAAMALCPWDDYKEWQPAGGDCNWSNPGNWSPPGVPGPCDFIAVLPSQPGPCITGNAQCLAIALNLWDPTSWGGQDTVVTIKSTALDVNFGAALQINSSADYDSATGGRAIVNIYGGTVTTPNWLNSPPTLSYGITIGGGSSTYGDSYGILNMYGGLVSVPRIAIYYGDVNLYGGTLQCTTDPNFVFSQDRPENRININGGTLKLKGNYVTELSGYIANGRIVCIRGGVLGVPVYDGTWTTLTDAINFNIAWSPQPVNNATNVHYKTPDGNSITLSWQPGDLAKQHDVYFGTSTGSLVYQGSRYDANGDPCNWAITGSFNMGYNYYWRIDETNDSNVLAQGLVWKFTTHDGKAYNPKPADDANVKPLSEPLQLSWTAGDWAQSTNGHRVFFGTNYSEIGAATITKTSGVYRGTVSSPVYPLSRLAETGPNPPGASFVLTAGKTYYWRIDEVNGATIYGGPSGGSGQVPSPSPTWSFTPAAYVNIDDFEDYNTTAELTANWLYGYTITHTGADTGCNSATAKGYAGRALIRDATGKYLQYTYNNSGVNSLFGGMFFSETKRAYPGGTIFTGGGVISPAPTKLRIDYKGIATNAANSISPMCGDNADLDRMYVAIEDTAGDVAVYLNPDANAQLVTNWTSWYTALKDINDIAHGTAPNGTPHTVNLEAITGFAIGFGIRGDVLDSDGVDANSIVMFDNIQLVFPTCVPEYGPLADFDGDCDVDINDLDIFVNYWLEGDVNWCWPEVTQPRAPILWYKFNGSDPNNLVCDYGTGDANNYTGTISAYITQNWEVGGGRDGNNCLYLPPDAGCYVNVPVASLGFMGDANHTTPGGGGISFSVWINADLTAPAMRTWWNGLFSIWYSGVTMTTLEVYCPSPTIPTTVDFIKKAPYAAASAALPEYDFSGRWNHFAFTKSANEMIIYCNGVVVGDVNTADDADVFGPLFNKNVGAFRIGTLGGNWGMWAGYIDDFEVYDYCLSAAEVAYLASDGDYCHIIPIDPIVQKANLKKSNIPGTEIIDFQDFAILGQQWRTEILWP
jgi:hypothetical protein